MANTLEIMPGVEWSQDPIVCACRNILIMRGKIMRKAAREYVHGEATLEDVNRAAEMAAVKAADDLLEKFPQLKIELPILENKVRTIQQMAEDWDSFDSIYSAATQIMEMLRLIQVKLPTDIPK